MPTLPLHFFTHSFFLSHSATKSTYHYTLISYTLYIHTPHLTSSHHKPTILISWWGMDNNDEIPSTPATPGTPGAPLFGGFTNGRNRTNSNSKSLLKSCRCFTVEDWTIEDGALPAVSCSLPAPPPVPLARKVGAEFIGTFILMFAATAAAIVNQKTNGSETLIGCAATTGLAVMIVILATGHISGAHVNPAVTLAFAALKHFPWKHVRI